MDITTNNKKFQSQDKLENQINDVDIEKLAAMAIDGLTINYMDKNSIDTDAFVENMGSSMISYIADHLNIYKTTIIRILNREPLTKNDFKCLYAHENAIIEYLEIIGFYVSRDNCSGEYTVKNLNRPAELFDAHYKLHMMTKPLVDKLKSLNRA